MNRAFPPASIFVVEVVDRDYVHAERITHQAWGAVEATGKPVKLEMHLDDHRAQPSAHWAEVSDSVMSVRGHLGRET